MRRRAAHRRVAGAALAALGSGLWLAAVASAQEVAVGPKGKGSPTFTITDLGTLGGATSSASATNDAGTVVGQAATADGNGHAFRWRPQTGMRDLGTQGGPYAFSQAYGLNNRGQVVGTVRGSYPDLSLHAC